MTYPKKLYLLNGNGNQQKITIALYCIFIFIVLYQYYQFNWKSIKKVARQDIFIKYIFALRNNK